MGKISKREVIAYKGMNSDMSCKGFHYEVGKTYKIDKVKLCKIGFHACLNPIDVLDYYSQSIKSRYFKVKLSGEITKCDEYDTKVATTEITILEEITIDELNNITEWWKHENVLDLLYFSEGFARIRNWEKQYNFIDKQGNILFNEWFKLLGVFHEGFAVVERSNNLCNFIDKQGNYLSNEWFVYVYPFYAWFARVQRVNGEWCEIDINGNCIKNLQ